MRGPPLVHTSSTSTLPCPLARRRHPTHTDPRLGCARVRGGAGGSLEAQSARIVPPRTREPNPRTTSPIPRLGGGGQREDARSIRGPLPCFSALHPSSVVIALPSSPAYVPAMHDEAWRTGLRQRALALQDALEAVIADMALPPHLQEIVERCREDLAVIVSATDEETAALLETGAVQSFEALRGLLQRQ